MKTKYVRLRLRSHTHEVQQYSSYVRLITEHLFEHCAFYSTAQNNTYEKQATRYQPIHLYICNASECTIYNHTEFQAIFFDHFLFFYFAPMNSSLLVFHIVFVAFFMKWIWFCGYLFNFSNKLIFIYFVDQDKREIQTENRR